MRRIVHYSLRLLVAVALGVFVAGCDESPTSVQDFDIQADVRPSTSDVVFFAGQSPNPSFEVTYQGLDEHPVAESTGDLQLNQVTQTGSPDRGEQVYELSFPRDVNGNSESALVQITSVRDGEQLVDSIEVQINNPISVTEDFMPLFAGVADYEDDERETLTSGGATVTSTQDVSPNSSGLNAIDVSMGSGGEVTFDREANLPGLPVFTFLARSDPNTDFNLTVTFTEETDGGTSSYDIDVPVQSGATWRKYTIAVGQLFADFNPVFEEAGGNGLFQSVSFSVDQDNVTFGLDELAFGVASAPVVEIEDFEQTTNAYGSFSNITISDTTVVGPNADGPVARTMTWVDGGNFFGYNYDRLRFDGASGGDVKLQIGRVTRGFDLFVFVETVDDNGRAGGYSFDAGQTVAVDAGDDFRQIAVPLGDLGTDASALLDPGIVNVGFEIRRRSNDDTEEPISFIIDNIRLQGD